MDTVTIRNEIYNARAHEARTHELAALLQRLLCGRQLRLLAGPVPDPAHQLFLFVCNFVDRTPDLLDTLLESTRDTVREDLCDAVAVVSLDFFLSPPPLLSGRRGLNGAMGKCYLCHRMIDELNDYCTLTSNTPLLPFDLSCANLIIRQLIGNPVASLLDELIQNTVLRLEGLTSINLSLVDPDDRQARLLLLCQQRALFDASQAPHSWIRSCAPAGTIH